MTSAQPSGIVAGYCYVYTLTGTDNVGNTATLSTTVVDSLVTFRVTSQPSTATAGRTFSGEEQQANEPVPALRHHFTIFGIVTSQHLSADSVAALAW